MGIRTAQVTVTTSPTLLAAADAVGEMVYLHSSSGTCYLGASDVTASTGYKMDNGDKITLHNREAALYAITSAGTVTMQVMAIER